MRYFPLQFLNLIIELVYYIILEVFKLTLSIQPQT